MVLDRLGLPPPQADLGDPAPLHFEDLDVEPVRLDPLADLRQASKWREQIPATGFESFALYLDAESIPDLVYVHLAAEDERAVALVNDGFALHVVLVADFADDLLEQVLDAH